MDLGEPPSDYKEKIKKYLDDALLDPYSAHVDFGLPPRRGSYRSWEIGGSTYAGYICHVIVNAKNRSGGYTGKQVYTFIFRNGRIVHVASPGETGKLVWEKGEE